MSLLSSNHEETQIVEIEIPHDSNEFIIDDPEIISIIIGTHNGQIPISSSDIIYEPVTATATSDVEQESSSSVCCEPTNTRKRIRKSDNWKITQRQKKFQAGMEFTNHRGKLRPKKEVKNLKDCLKVCKFQCAKYISVAERSNIFENYYSLDQIGKYNFISSTTQRIETKRKSVKDHVSRRFFSFYYYFNLYGNRVPVCKKFYLGTLDISQKPIYTVHKKINSCNVVSKSARGTTSSRKVDQARVDIVMRHITSFPCIESHYCREKTKKKYPDSNLNVLRMYDLYVVMCEEQAIVPVKVSFYRSIFNTKFNLDFFKPKADRCSVCELHKIDASRLKDGAFETHNALKNTMRELKEADKKSGIPILCFDMQKVITCPRSNIDASYYLTKLNVYNLTAHLSTTKTVYCAMWNEAAMGRTGNDIASALYKILERVFNDNHDLTQLITWSDSCVPQNKNSYMSYAVQLFLKKHPQISSIEMRYSLPGHSCIQEVDHAHSQIEKVMSTNEFFSPIGLIRLMKTINRKKPYTIIQLKPEDFKNFDIPAKSLNYKAVPFASLRMLGFGSNLYVIKHNSTYLSDICQEVSIRPTIKSTRVSGNPTKTPEVLWRDPPISITKKPIPINKILDLQKMFQFMGIQDLEYYKNILKLKK